jgi:hypothetical protein
MNIVACDECKNDISETYNSIDWRIYLGSERIPSREGVVTDMYIPPVFKNNLHFCSFSCLKKYISNYQA